MDQRLLRPLRRRRRIGQQELAASLGFRHQAQYSQLERRLRPLGDTEAQRLVSHLGLGNPRNDDETWWALGALHPTAGRDYAEGNPALYDTVEILLDTKQKLVLFDSEHACDIAAQLVALAAPPVVSVPMNLEGAAREIVELKRVLAADPADIILIDTEMGIEDYVEAVASHGCDVVRALEAEFDADDRAAEIAKELRRRTS